jgi:hypothetical protein
VCWLLYIPPQLGQAGRASCAGCYTFLHSWDRPGGSAVLAAIPTSTAGPGREGQLCWLLYITPQLGQLCWLLYIPPQLGHAGRASCAGCYTDLHSWARPGGSAVLAAITTSAAGPGREGQLCWLLYLLHSWTRPGGPAVLAAIHSSTAGPGWEGQLCWLLYLPSQLGQAGRASCAGCYTYFHSWARPGGSAVLAAISTSTAEPGREGLVCWLYLIHS